MENLRAMAFSWPYMTYTYNDGQAYIVGKDLLRNEMNSFGIDGDVPTVASLPT